MEPLVWAKVHGASVHFPIALILSAAVIEIAASLVPQSSPMRGGLDAAGYWTLVMGAAGAVPAAASGLLLSKGVLLGHGMLRTHHLFAWPALALGLGLGTWRILSGRGSQHRSPVFLAALILASVLVVVAGY